MAGTQHTLKHRHYQRLVEQVDALDVRLKALRQQQERIKKQQKQVKLQKARRDLLS
jgi:chaperonin cofactor prefoldin